MCLRQWRTSRAPLYLEINEMAPNRYDVLWRTPLNAGMRLPVALKFPDHVRNITEPNERELPDSIIDRRLIEVNDGGLAGKRVDFIGLQGTITDVLVRVQMRDGSFSTTLVRPSQAWVEIGAARGMLAIASAYLVLGIEHILTGVDHLLFVLGLLLLVRGFGRLVKTVSAFTVAHSVTLALATLGFVHVPSPPVEAVIALSIVFVAKEIVRSRGRSASTQPSLTERQPWLVAFSFGLLHGLGFAGGLSEVGLPEGHIPLALLLFSIGVEVGHFGFIAVVFALMALGRRAMQWLRLPALRSNQSAVLRLLPPYAIGGTAMFWLIERIAAF